MAEMDAPSPRPDSPAGGSPAGRSPARRSPARAASLALGVALTVLTLAEVNYPHLGPQSQLALFALLGLLLCFLERPINPHWGRHPLARVVDGVLALTSAVVCLYVVVQGEPIFSAWWSGGQSLGNRAGQETGLDLAVGVVGLFVVLEATRRVIGWTLPLLAGIFLVYAGIGPHLPSWLLPHRGYGLERIAAQTFLHSQGVFGVALSVMFTYVFLFVLFGAFLEATGATGAIIRFARRAFVGSQGGAAKVAVVASGLMGSLSGSAVANTATTGTFTIPMMRSAGFSRAVAAGVEAAASSGGALMPPVMGAGAYMMLELVDPPVTYLQIIRAALIPALLYYLSIFLIVHFRALRVGARTLAEVEAEVEAEIARERDEGGENASVEGAEEKRGTEKRGTEKGADAFPGVVFAAALASLILFLLLGYTAFRAVSLALLVTVVLGAFSARTRLGPGAILRALSKAARDAVPLITAAACVGILIGVVTLTGVGSRLPALVLPLAEHNLLAALALIMASSLVLGMGLPSAVCYLLMATLMGPALGGLGVEPLAAHLFIFYFGMMSMVTPPVALAAYTAASISGAGILEASFAAFRFALVGFTLPYMFVYRPELLLLGENLSAGRVAWAVIVALLGVTAFAAGIAGHLFGPTSRSERLLLLAAAALLLVPAGDVAVAGLHLPLSDLAGALTLVVGALINRRRHPRREA